jgi:hypothetical protein
MVTNTVVIILCDEAVLIWAIPPLSPQLPDFSDRNPTHMPPPLFRIPFPDISHHPARMEWNTISPWYFGSSQPLYFDMLCRDSKLHRFQIMLSPDLSTASLHVINTSEHTSLDFDDIFFENYRICEDTLVSCWIYAEQHQGQYQPENGVYTGLTSTRFSNVTTGGRSAVKVLLPDTGHFLYRLYTCPASGRFVIKDTNRVAIVDLF